MSVEDMDRFSEPTYRIHIGLRRAVDVLGAGGAAFILAPLMLIVALAIWIESGRPILFSQIRLGQYGRPFRMYKFRKFGPDCHSQGCPLTMEADGRLTKVGRVLAVRSCFDMKASTTPTGSPRWISTEKCCSRPKQKSISLIFRAGH